MFRDGMLEFMDTLDSAVTVDFAEHGEAAKMTPADYFRRYLQHQPKVVEFAELAAGRRGRRRGRRSGGTSRMHRRVR